MMEKILIENDKLTPEMERIRSGRTQLFRRKGLDNNFTSKDNADVILTHENKAMYAKLIDGKWYWVSGCAECNGKPRDCWGSYIECEKHDVCKICAKPRSDFKEAVWGGKDGWKCNSCQEVLDAEVRRAAFEKLASKEYDEWDFRGTDNIVCPHCGSSYNHDCDIPEDKEECRVCGGEYNVEPEYSVTFSTSVVGKRLTK